MNIDQLKPNLLIRGALFPEPVQVIATILLGESVKVIGHGLQTNQVYQSILTPEQLSFLETSPETEPFDGDAKKFRLGVEALRLGLAYEYDPYFSLSIARVDPLPHQLEAVYDYFMRLPRIRFLQLPKVGNFPFFVLPLCREHDCFCDFFGRKRVNPFDELMRMMPPFLSYGCYADLQNTGRDLPPL